MKTVLCYGDSLTWGYDAETLGRHALEDRWPSVLAKALGPGVQVIAEGLNGKPEPDTLDLARGLRNQPALLCPLEVEETA